jgi:flagellin
MLDSNGDALNYADLLVGANDAYRVGTTSTITSTNPSETITVKQPATLASIDLAIANLNTYRSTLGASQNRLEYAADNLTNIAQNTQAARSRILDTDYASESTELARTQILQQAGTAMLAQANTQAQIVTSLLP